MTPRRRKAVVCCALLLAVARVAAQEVAVPLIERARGAERVVVGQVAATTPAWRVNEFGDRLIVTVVRVVATETLKGAAQSSVDVEVEGGTIDGLTLRVSDLPAFTPGDRAVFYLRRNAAGSFIPHLRGEGLIRLDPFDRVPGSSLDLNEVRRTVTASQAR